MAEGARLNLYWVYPAGDDWGVFVFAASRNRARVLALQASEFDGWSYMDLRARQLARDLVGSERVVVTEDDPGYELVSHLGLGFGAEEVRSDG